MATVPASYADLVTAKRVQVYTNTSAVSTADAFNPAAAIPAVSSADADADELISVTDISFAYDPPETRTNIGRDRIYTHGAPDILFPILCEGNSDMVQFFYDRVQEDATTLEIPVFVWVFRITNALGEQMDVRFRGKVTSFRVEKSRGEQSEYMRVSASIRAIDRVPAVDMLGAPMLELAFVDEDRETLTLRFSEAINPTTIRASDITLSPSRALSTDAEDFVVRGRTVTAKFSSAIAAGTYTVTVASTVEDTSGNPMGTTRSRTFTVEA